MKRLLKPVNSFKKVLDTLLPYSELITSDTPTEGLLIRIENEFAKFFFISTRVCECP